MRRTGKRSLVPAIGMKVGATTNGVFACAVATPGASEAAAPPAATSAADWRIRRRRFIGPMRPSLRFPALRPQRPDLAHDATAKRQHADDEDRAGDHGHPLAEARQVVFQADQDERAD